MSLQSLVLCSDDKIMRLLRRVLADLEVGVEQSDNADSAVQKLTRQRFEAVIVDCEDEAVAFKVLSSARSAPCNKHAVAVALIDGSKAVRSAFALGAHFVLYKPISAERAKTSFRAARALMKCERRRNNRIPVEIPVSLTWNNGTSQRRAITSDLSEGGMAIQLAHRPEGAENLRAQFTLPGSQSAMECSVQVAWENGGSGVGLRFKDMTPEHSDLLKAWVARHSPETEKDDPPAPCKLTDLSPGACYLEINAPFPVGTRVTLSMRAAEVRAQVGGIVRVMHPEAGMGVEFARNTKPQQDVADKFIHSLTSRGSIKPELMVKPEGMDSEAAAATPSPAPTTKDPLLDLFLQKAAFPPDHFLAELRKQRHPQAKPASAAAAPA